MEQPHTKTDGAFDNENLVKLLNNTSFLTLLIILRL